MGDLRPLLEMILEHAPAPRVDESASLQFQAVTFGYDAFVGRLVIGRVERTRQLFGRVLPEHIAAEEDRVRADALID